MVFREEIGEIPHLADFTYHKTVPDIDFDDVPVPGLDADFYRRPVGDRALSVGVYRFGDVETHRAWGWVGEAHCSWHAYRNPATGGFDGPFRGCPELRLLLDGGRLRGFELGSGSLARRFAVAGAVEKRTLAERTFGSDAAVPGAFTARPTGPVQSVSAMPACASRSSRVARRV